MSADENNKVRFERLRLVARKALEQLIKKSLTMEQVKTCFPTLVTSQDGVRSLELALSQMSGFWHANSLDEFDLIYKEKDIESKLDELDDIIQNAQRAKDSGTKPSNIDQLSPLEIVYSTIVSNSKNVLDSLQMIYDQLCRDNAELYTELSELTKESTRINNSIKSGIEQLNKEANSVELEKAGLQIDKLIDILEEK